MKPAAPYSRILFFILGIAFLASEMALVSALWTKWGPTVAVLAGFALFSLFGWVARRLGFFSPENADRTASGPQKRILGLAMGAVWLIGMISWFPMAEIETAALKQPDHPTSEFSQPLHVKGVVRYVTPQQARIDEIAHWTFFGGIAALVGFALLNRYLKRNERSDSETLD